MKKIAFSAMAYDAGKSGISTYINEVVVELCQQHKVTMIILESDLNHFSYRHENLDFWLVKRFCAKPLLNMLWHLFFLPWVFPFKKYDFCYLPAANRRVLAYCPIPSVGIFHDLSQLHVPEKYDSLRMFYVKKVIPFFLRKVTSLFAVSQSTKKDMVNFYNFPAEKITVNHNGFRALSDSANELPKKINSAKIKNKYIYYVSRLEHPGKNHIGLIEAYEKLPQNIKDQYNLVFSGQDWSGCEAIYAKINNSPDQDKILNTGYVSSQELLKLYQEASLFVFPSKFEGFGFPLLEAMAADIPVICSSTSSLPEVGGKAALYFDPQSPDDIMLQILKVLESEKCQKDLIEAGKEQVKKFTWHHHVEKILAKLFL